MYNTQNVNPDNRSSIFRLKIDPCSWRYISNAK